MVEIWYGHTTGDNCLAASTLLANSSIMLHQQLSHTEQEQNKNIHTHTYEYILEITFEPINIGYFPELDLIISLDIFIFI